MIQVFDMENGDNHNITKKEELLQQVLQLGGDNYTFEDLRRDILSFNEEYQSNRDIENIVVKSLCKTGDSSSSEHQRLTEHILQELVNEEEESLENI